MLASILSTIPQDISPNICKVQGLLLYFTAMTRLAFTVVMANSIYSNHKDREDKFRNNEKIGLCIIFLIISIAAAIPFSTDSYGRGQTLCLIKVYGEGHTYGVIWRYTLYFVPVLSTVIYNCYVYYSLIKHVMGLQTLYDIEGSYLQDAVKKLAFYPAILILVWIPGFINSIIEITNSDYVNIYSWSISAGLISGMGFFNAIAYGMTSEVREVLFRSCCKKFKVRNQSVFDTYGSLIN
jgi:hypothetical protein